MINLLGGIKFSGADAHEGNSVPVRLVHICLDLKHKRGKIVIHGVNGPAVCVSCQGRGCHFEKVLKRSPHRNLSVRNRRTPASVLPCPPAPGQAPRLPPSRSSISSRSCSFCSASIISSARESSRAISSITPSLVPFWVSEKVRIFRVLLS